MSKVVKGIGRAISKVVKGVANVVKSVVKSPVGKILLAAATVYFGGAAIMGAMGGASAGTGVLGTVSGALQGAGAGISSAWSGLTGAAGALAGGQGLSAAGSSLSGGFTGAYGAGSGAVGASTLAASGGALPAAPGAYSSIGTSGATAAGTTAGTAASGGGIAEGLIGAAKINAGTQLAGNVISGYGQQKAMEEQRDFELKQQQAARDRYNENVGTSWWNSGSSNTGAPVSAAYAEPPQSGLIAGYMTPQERYAEDMRRRLATYNPYALPTA